MWRYLNGYPKGLTRLQGILTCLQLFFWFLFFFSGQVQKTGPWIGILNSIEGSRAISFLPQICSFCNCIFFWPPCAKEACVNACEDEKEGRNMRNPLSWTEEEGIWHNMGGDEETVMYPCVSECLFISKHCSPFICICPVARNHNFWHTFPWLPGSDKNSSFSHTHTNWKKKTFLREDSSSSPLL